MTAAPWTPGWRVGRYRLVREIGRGGMGAVYLAERDDREYRHQVAIKRVQADLAGPNLKRRLISERQILAGLDHPGIARLLDGGTTDEGTPYVVMEYVDGLPIDRYCDKRGLDLDRRIELFARVCDAVQYAHRNLVVHRDLKPGNILVTERGDPKLLDFGIAKLLDPGGRVGVGSGATAMMMTPRFASPEQIRQEPVTTVSDVYSLGVLLFSLLTGDSPYGKETATPARLERAVCGEDPPAASEAVARVDDPRAVASARGTRPEALARRLRGDLDVIVACALRKEPNRRYGTAEQLAGDLRRHLEGDQVSARPDTWAYRTVTFVRRNRLLVAAALMLTLVLAGFAAAMTAQAARLARERDAVSRERVTAERVSDFLIDLFRFSDPAEARGGQITAREILDRGAGQVTQGLADQPEIQATLMETMGRVYQSLGLYDDAGGLLDRSLEIRQSTPDAGPLAIARSLDGLGVQRLAVGNLDESIDVLTRAHQLRASAYGGDHADLAVTEQRLAESLRQAGRYADALPWAESSLSMRRRLFGEEHVDVADSMSGLALLLQDMGEYARARQLGERALASRRELLGDDHPAVAASLKDLALMLQDQGDLRAAERWHREALERDRRVLGEEHPEVTSDLYNLASVLKDSGDLQGAETTMIEVIERDRRQLGPEHPYVALNLNNLANIKNEQGSLREAERLYREGLALQETIFDGRHPEIATTLSNLGNVLRAQRRHAEAESVHRRALALRRELLGPDHHHVAISLTSLAHAIQDQGRLEEAERLHREAYRARVAALGEEHPSVGVAMSGVASVLAARGRDEEAAEWFEKSVEMHRRTLPAGHPRTAHPLIGLARVRMRQQRLAEALPLLQEALEIRRNSLPAGHRLRVAAEALLQECQALLDPSGSAGSGP